MKSNLEYIDDYFTDLMTESEKVIFNNRIKDDDNFAKEVAHYLQAKQLKNFERKQHFYELNKSLNKKSSLSIIKGIGSIAAAAILIFGLWTLFLKHEQTPQAYAQKYINEKLIFIDTDMSASQDTLSNAVELYNQKKYQAALDELELSGLNNPLVLEYVGLCNLQLGNYKLASDTFKVLAENQEIIQNKGLFYQAISLIKMNKVQEAKRIIDLIEKTPNAFGKKETLELKRLMD